MRESLNIQYIYAPNKEAFPDDEVAELVNILNNVDSTRSGERHKIALALENTEDASRIFEIDPAHWPIKHMRQLRNEGQTIVAKDGEKTVGMIGLQEHHKAPDGQRIFEIRRNTVLSDYRGRGIGRSLRESMIKRIQEIDPSALLVSRIHKDNAANQNLAGSTEFRKISYDDVEKLGFAKEDIEQNKQWGYEFYVLDLREKA